MARSLPLLPVLLLLALSSLLSVSCRPSPLATSNASRKPGGGKRGGKPGGKSGGKSGGSKKGVSAVSCPSPWPELDSCPTSESLPQLEDSQTEFPGAVWGALRPHKVPGARNSPADATWLNKDERDTEVYIEECCSLCALNDACEYWTYTRKLDSIKGTCQLFSSQQCAPSNAYSAISAPASSPRTPRSASSSASSPRTHHPVSSPKVSFSFRKAPKDAALPTPGGSDGTGGNGGAGGGTGAGTAGGGLDDPLTGTGGSGGDSSSGDSSGSGGSGGSSSGGGSSTGSGTTTTTGNTTCPSFSGCLSACPAGTSAITQLYSDTSAPATSAAANVARGRLYGVESPAAGWSVLGEAGYLSIGGCCQACKAGASNDCYYWTWQHDPKEGDYDRAMGDAVTRVRRGQAMTATTGRGNMIQRKGIMIEGCALCSTARRVASWQTRAFWQHMPHSLSLSRCLFLASVPVCLPSPPSFPGLCTLFHSQACRFMTDEGFFSPPVFDPAQTNSFMFPLPCYSAV
ncbi:unnamed protein product [Closterium sp. Naga37s-1]|nr:unnamed protein product [Closterium sp. Naga37s-1]